MVVMYCILIISDVAWFNNQGARAKVIKTIEGEDIGEGTFPKKSTGHFGPVAAQCSHAETAQ